jgi:hypothetical protein
MEYLSAVQNGLIYTIKLNTSVRKYTVTLISALHKLISRPALMSSVVITANTAVTEDYVLRLRDLGSYTKCSSK